MSKQSSPSLLPGAPKALGLSRRLFVLVLCVGILVISLFFIFLHITTPKAFRVSWSHSIMPLDQSNALTQIHKIAHEVHQDSRIGLLHHDYDHRLLTETGSKTASLSADGFRQASEATISVYKRPTSLSVAKNVPKKISAPQVLRAYTLSAGSIIPATLVTGINSSLPGMMIAKVREDVFDTVSGNNLLIPQGTTLVGNYAAKIAYGQSRILIVWSRLIFPNGTSFNLKNMPGADLTGMSGLHDQVNNHYLRLFGSALMFSIFGAAGQLSQSQHDSALQSTQQILYAAVGQQMSQTAMQLMAKNMNIQPTLKIRPGTSFNVLLTRDMVLPHPYHFL